MANVAAVKRTKTKTVMITGASGFLGQHLVKLAHTRNDQNITKLVLFDKVPFTKKLGKSFADINFLCKGLFTNTVSVSVNVSVKFPLYV